MDNNKSVILLDGWSIAEVKIFYCSPESSIIRFRGKCFGHPLIPNNLMVLTTPIVSYEETPCGYLFMTSRGRVYRLGAIDPEYNSLFPDALNRMIKVFKLPETKEIT